MFNFETFFQELKDGAIDIAKNEASDYIREATDDGQEFLESIKDDLQTWMRQAAEGQLSKEDLAFLIRGKRDLAQMKALTQAGLAAARIERMRTAAIDLVISAADKAV